MDKDHPNHFCVMVFEKWCGNASDTKPVWRSETKRYTEVIAVFSDFRSYQPLRNVARLYNKHGKYCFSVSINLYLKIIIW